MVTKDVAPGPSSTTGPATSRAVAAYAGLVSVCGLGLLAMVLATQLPRIAWASAQMRPTYLLMVLLFAGELRRMRVVRRDGDTDRLTVSATFAVALVMAGPLALALVTQVAATAIDDLRRRRPPLVVAFNAGQYALTLTAVRVVYSQAAGQPFLDPVASGTGSPGGSQLALTAAVAAAATYFVLNLVIVGVVLSLVTGEPLAGLLREDLRVQGLDSCILLGLAPITALLVSIEPILAVLIVLPLLGVQRNAHIAAQRQHESLHDSLTGLPNRTLFTIRAEQALTRATGGGGGGRFALMLVDLDHFKEVNDTLGHHIGDGLLREVAQRMSAAAEVAGAGTGATTGGGAAVTVARLGGDEFAIVYPDVAGLPQATDLAEELIRRLQDPLSCDGVQLSVHASIGVALYPDHGATVTTLLKRADIAMYRAKANRGEVHSYRHDMDTHSVERLSLHGDLHTATDRDELQMVFQPQVTAATGELTGFEALMRWNHPLHGAVPPDVFIPMAESSGLISDLTRLSIQSSLILLSSLRDLPPTGAAPVIAVNLSARLLADPVLPQWLSTTLDQAGIDPARLTIEVTESTIAADPARALSVLAQIREHGTRISIDDFGTGYSSLAYLAELHPDEIKIDKSFVQTLRSSPTSAVIIRTTIDLAHGLGLPVVAEGVEDQATYDALTTLGCDRIQGYHIARPMSAPALHTWLNRLTGTDSQPASPSNHLIDPAADRSTPSIASPSWTPRPGRGQETAAATATVVPLPRPGQPRRGTA